MTEIFSKSHSLAIKSSPWRPITVEEKARAHRYAAGNNAAVLLWCGTLYPRHEVGAMFSTKVFVGGVPWDITNEDLEDAFCKFGPMKLEWPVAFTENRLQAGNARGTGYVYVIFEREKSIRTLLGNSQYEWNNNMDNFFYKVSSAKIRNKQVQIIPWQLNNSNYINEGSSRIFGTEKTVFVGSLHGMITAEGLAVVMDDLFGGVLGASIDTDKYKYPIGSGRVTFDNLQSYYVAIQTSFVELRTQKFNKKIQIDPFLEDSDCNVCNLPSGGDLFCRETECFKYYCPTCWDWQHSMTSRALEWHKPVSRHPRNHPQRIVGTSLTSYSSGSPRGGSVSYGSSRASSVSPGDLDFGPSILYSNFFERRNSAVRI